MNGLTKAIESLNPLILISALVSAAVTCATLYSSVVHDIDIIRRDVADIDRKLSVIQRRLGVPTSPYHVPHVGYVIDFEDLTDA